MFPDYEEIGPLEPSHPLLLKWVTARARMSSDFALVVGNVSQEQKDGFLKKSFPAANVDWNQSLTYLPESAGQDYWQTLAETNLHRTGDCEDYAVYKYAMLLGYGFPEVNMRVCVGQIEAMPKNRDHAFLAVKLEDTWCVLDMLFDQMIEAKDYVNWLPSAAFWGPANSVRFGHPFRIADMLKEGKA